MFRLVTWCISWLKQLSFGAIRCSMFTPSGDLKHGVLKDKYSLLTLSLFKGWNILNLDFTYWCCKMEPIKVSIKFIWRVLTIIDNCLNPCAMGFHRMVSFMVRSVKLEESTFSVRGLPTWAPGEGPVLVCGCGCPTVVALSRSFSALLWFSLLLPHPCATTTQPKQRLCRPRG